MNPLPEGKSKISSSIRDLDRRLKRIEPKVVPGVLTSIDPTGVSQIPINSLMGKASAKSNSAPRYR